MAEKPVYCPLCEAFLNIYYKFALKQDYLYENVCSNIQVHLGE